MICMYLSNILNKGTEPNEIIVWSSIQVNFVPPSRWNVMVTKKGWTFKWNLLLEYLVNMNTFLLELLEFLY